MNKKFFLWLVTLAFHAGIISQTDDIVIASGSKLVYEVKEGGKSYLFTVTIRNWDDADDIKFSWYTNEKPTPRKGAFTLDEYFNISSETFFAGIPTSADQQFTESESCIFLPTTLQEYLLEDEDEAEFTLIENGKKYLISSKTAEIENYLEKPLKYNGQEVEGNYAHIISADKSLELGMLQETESYNYLLAYYHSATLTMELLSITTRLPSGDTPSAVATQPTDKIVASQKMDPVKLTAVKKAYPLLSTLESFDVTENGTSPKPFSETYDFRQSSGAKNPPSAIDCFTADLKILYNQRKNYGLENMPETIGEKSLPLAAAKKLINIYMTYEARNVPGYKPWTHWKFIRGLSAVQQAQLAKDLEGYVKQYGFTE